MTDTCNALVQNVVRNPYDTLARGVLRDYVEEQGWNGWVDLFTRQEFTLFNSEELADLITECYDYVYAVYGVPAGAHAYQFYGGVLETIWAEHDWWMTHAKQVCASTPVRFCQITDREPLSIDLTALTRIDNRGRYFWHNDTDTHPLRTKYTHYLNEELYRQLQPDTGGYVPGYVNEHAAYHDLSRAAVDYGRAVAKLPPLKRERQ